MTNLDAEGIFLERKIGDTKIRMTPKEGESLNDVYRRFIDHCRQLEKLEEVRIVLEPVLDVFLMTKEERTDIGLISDYHLVILSLMRNFDECMGTTTVAREWDINTGRPTRIFRASRDSSLRGHFEECNGGYRFTNKGLKHALEIGIRQILDLIG